MKETGIVEQKTYASIQTEADLERKRRRIVDEETYLIECKTRRHLVNEMLYRFNTKSDYDKIM